MKLIFRLFLAAFALLAANAAFADERVVFFHISVGSTAHSLRCFEIDEHEVKMIDFHSRDHWETWDARGVVATVADGRRRFVF